MPWSPQLGMNVFDPLQAYASGQPAAAAGAAAFRQESQQKQEEKDRALNERKMKILEEDHARQQQQNDEQAKSLQLRGLGMKDLQTDLDNGVPFEDAMFKHAGKLFADKPQVLGQIMHQHATDLATKVYRETMQKKAQGLIDEKQQQLLHPAPTSEEKNSKKLGELTVERINLQKLIQANPDKAYLKDEMEGMDARIKGLQPKQAAGGTTKPEVQVIGGHEFIVNPKTGSFKELERSVSKHQFINQHLSAYVNRFGTKAMDKLSEDWGKLGLSKSAPAQPQDSSGDNTTPDAGEKILDWDQENEALSE